MQRERIAESINATLLNDLSKDKEGAFRVLYDVYKNNIFNVAMVYLQDELEATEVVQQVFIRLWEKRHLLTEVEKLQDYIFITTRNIVFDHLRQLGRQAELLGQYRQQIHETDSSTDGIINERNIMGLWLNIVSRLPSQQQQVYTMIEQQGVNIDKTAAILSISKATVKKHLELARRFVRVELKKALQHDSGGTAANINFLQIFL